MKNLAVKYKRAKWGESSGWEATLTVDGEKYAQCTGKDYLQVVVAIQGYVMNLANEASSSSVRADD